MIISMGQLYGVILYYATSMFDHYYYDVAYSRPERYYFWGYYFLTNFFWVLIPGRKENPSHITGSMTFPLTTNIFTELIWNSCRDIAAAFRAIDKMKISLQNGNGASKKLR